MEFVRAVRIALFAALIAGPVSGQVGFEWEQRASLPASGRWGAFTFVIDGMGYVAGGGNGTMVFSELWRYDPFADAWEQRASMPGPRRHGVSWSINGKGYVVCGQITINTYSAAVWEYDPVADAWSVKTPLPAQARYGAHGFGLNGQGYVGGGNYGSDLGPYLTDFWRYDPVADAWFASTDIPGQARYGSTSFVTGGKGYVHGGRVADLSFTNELWEFEPNSQTWNQKPSMPGPGRSWSLVMPFINDAVVACGKDSLYAVLEDGYWYTPWTDTWDPIPDYPGNSGWSGASCTLGDRVFGGLGAQIMPTWSYHNDWWELVKVSTVHVQVLADPGYTVLTLAPNPVCAGNMMEFRLPSNFGRSPLIQIVDALGRDVKELQRPNGPVLMVRAPEVRGTYFVRYVEDGELVAWSKLIVQ